MLKPTPQQQALIDTIKSDTCDIELIARAGTGKTASIIMAVPHMEGTIECLAYNKAAGEELNERAIKAGVSDPDVKFGTVHASAFRVWKKAYPKVVLNDKKVSGLLDTIVEAAKTDDKYAKASQMVKQYGTFLRKLVSLAKQRALGVDSPTAEQFQAQLMEVVDHFGLEDELVRTRAIRPAYGSYAEPATATDPELLPFLLRIATRVYKRSLELCPTEIDFDDMILAPLYYKCQPTRKDWVIIDEAQDTNPARKLFALSLVKPTGRLLIVGDPMQAIYGFSGADHDSMDALKRMREEAGKTVKVLPLTLTHRCPKAVVRHANTLVPDFQAADDAPEGEVRTIHETKLAAEKLGTGDAILCRKMAPLVEMAYQFIAKRTPFVFDAREFGTGLKKLVNTVSKQDYGMSTAEFEAQLKEYATEEMAKLILKNAEAKAERLETQVETLLVFTGVCAGKTVAAILVEMESLFENQKQRSGVLLTTVHRSKGREWDRVFLLGRNLWMPSKWAKKAWQMTQENNLIYVGITRAKRTLVEVVVEAKRSTIIADTEPLERQVGPQVWGDLAEDFSTPAEFAEKGW